MKIIQTKDGRWGVASGEELVAGPFDSNSQAWRALDRLAGDPVSRGEKTADWLWGQRVMTSWLPDDINDAPGFRD